MPSLKTLNVVVLKICFYLVCFGITLTHTKVYFVEHEKQGTTTIFMKIFYHVNEMKYGQESKVHLHTKVQNVMIHQGRLHTKYTKDIVDSLELFLSTSLNAVKSEIVKIFKDFL